MIDPLARTDQQECNLSYLLQVQERDSDSVAKRLDA